MKWDVFISYARDDEEWAAKLEQDLTDQSLDVYRDQTRLKPGAEWHDDLMNALQNSRHLVVLWSDTNAKPSRWVKKEADSFSAFAHLAANGLPPVDRRLIQVSLEGLDEAYDQWQAITAIHDSGTYPAGASKVDVGAWESVVDQIFDTVRRNDEWPSVNLAVLASTRSRMAAIEDSRSAPGNGDSFASTLARLRIDSKDEFLKHYGDQPSHWRPFGSGRNILAVMASIRLNIQKQFVRHNGLPFLWRPLGSALWTEDLVDSAIQALEDEPSVIVIDPLSLFDAKVFTVYDMVLDNCADNEDAAIVMLPPICSERREYMHSFLKRTARRLYAHSYLPAFKESRIAAAQCHALAQDQPEILKLMTKTVRGVVKKHSTKYTRQ